MIMQGYFWRKLINIATDSLVVVGLRSEAAEAPIRVAEGIFPAELGVGRRR